MRTVWTLLAKDLKLEWRERARTLSIVLFAVVTLLLFSFALGPDVEALRSATPGFLVGFITLILAALVICRGRRGQTLSV